MKKILSSITALSLVAGMLAIEASASIKAPDSVDAGCVAGSGMWLVQLYNEGNPDENKPATKYDIDYTAFSSVRFTFGLDEESELLGDMWLDFFEGAIGGGIVLSCNGGDIYPYSEDPTKEYDIETPPDSDVWNTYNWDTQSWWGCSYINASGKQVSTNPNEDDDPTNDLPVSAVDLGDYTYELTADITNPLTCETDEWDINKVASMQVGLQEWGADLVSIVVLKCEILDDEGNVLIWFDESGKPSLENIAIPEPEEPEEPEQTDPYLSPVILRPIDGIDTDGVLLEWTANTSADGYAIEVYKNDKWTTAKKITDNSTTSYIVDGLSEGTVYKFRIKAYKTTDGVDYYSSSSNEEEACTMPPQLTGLEVTKTTTDKITLSWDKNEIADGYIISQYFVEDGYIEWKKIATIEGADNTTYTVSGLDAFTVYDFRVQLYKEFNNHILSGMGASIREITNIANITGFKLGGRASNALRLNWTENTSADGYIIEQYKGGKWVRIAKITNNATTTYRVTGLAAGTAYKFRMKAYKMNGSTATYSSYTSTLSARTNPSNVTGLKLGGRASNALRLNWTKNTSADGYIVEQYKSGKWVRIARITGNTTTTYRVTELKASTQYKFRVKAYKMSGSTALYSGYTSTLSAYTNPSKVANLKITGKAGAALRLGWSKNASADGYIVEMYSGGKWVRVAKITSNATVTYRKSGLKKGTTYKFRVRTYNMVGKTALYGGYVNISGTTNR